MEIYEGKSVFGGAVASDFIYLDAGTTTGFMIDHITEKARRL